MALAAGPIDHPQVPGMIEINAVKRSQILVSC